VGDLFDFERGWIIRVCLAGATMAKTAALLGASRVTVWKVMLAYTNHRKTISVKRNSGRKSALTGRDCHILRKIVLKNQRTAAAQVTAELNRLPEDPVSTKTVQHELHKSHIHGRAAIAKPLITD
jgi:hypothetical protein